MSDKFQQLHEKISQEIQECLKQENITQPNQEELKQEILYLEYYVLHLGDWLMKKLDGAYKGSILFETLLKRTNHTIPKRFW
jgi:hypothetical protein